MTFNEVFYENVHLLYIDSKFVPLLTGGSFSEVALCHEKRKWNPHMVVAVVNASPRPDFFIIIF